MIQERFPDDEWIALLTDQRVSMARNLLEERLRLKQNISLLDCLQFGDVGRIMIKDEDLFSKTRFKSKSQAKDRISPFQKLRNDLAHSQGIVENDWDTIMDVAKLSGEVFE